MLPTMLIAPEQKRRLEFRKPMPKDTSSPSPLGENLSPNESTLSSILSAVPANPPRIRENSAARVSGASKAMSRPSTRVMRPDDVITIVLNSLLILDLKNSPRKAPIITADALIIVAIMEKRISLSSLQKQDYNSSMTTVFLLAGLSKRMGGNKLLLPYHGRYLFESTLESALTFSDRIIAVLGYEEERMRDALKGYDIEIRVNRDYEQGQKSSTLIGLCGIWDDIAILPGDLPLLKKDDWVEGLRYISLNLPARPTFDGMAGHPVFVPRRLKKGLETSSKPFKVYLEDEGIYQYPASIGCIFDIDTKERYEELLDMDGTINKR